MLGFSLIKNFDSPYRASSITDFWRRWHISLSCWLRDYLYVPLGGNRRGRVRTYLNLMAVMLNLAPKQVGVDYTAVTAVWGAVTAVFTQVLQFHRGSSQGSKDNRALLDKVMSK